MSLGYSKLRNLPSRYIPYPDGTEILVRPFKWGEVSFMFEHKDQLYDILCFIRDTDVVKGIDFDEITVDDWMYIELSIVNMTFSNIKYTITAGKCPQCGDVTKSLEFDGPDGKKREFKVSSNLTSVVAPSAVSFNQLDEAIDVPIIVNLDSGSYDLDFFRVKHFLHLVDEGLDPQDEYEQLKLVSNVDPKELPVEDLVSLKYVYDLLDHGQANEFTVSCPICTSKYKISTDWEVSEFIPFRVTESDIRSRIQFGKVDKPTSKTPRRSGLRKGPSIVP